MGNDIITQVLFLLKACTAKLLLFGDKSNILTFDLSLTFDLWLTLPIDQLKSRIFLFVLYENKTLKYSNVL